ncbi:unnamed protein product [Colias eurytheme]|nr:unnamed protein product [Colias eurytheme]
MSGAVECDVIPVDKGGTTQGRAWDQGQRILDIGIVYSDSEESCVKLCNSPAAAGLRFAQNFLAVCVQQSRASSL